MYFIESTAHDPLFNLAMEEYLLKNYEKDFFILYRNSPCLVVGKHQNTMAEINLQKVENENIQVVRRLSGGGTVYHDLGNLNYCLIKKGEQGKLVNFEEYSSPIIQALRSLGVEAKFEGKSDLTIDGKKFSGNASHIYKNKIMQHGTMLFSSDLKQLNQLLRVNPLKFKHRGIRSIRSHVTNISDHLAIPLTIEEFSKHVIEHIQEVWPNSKSFQLSEKDRNGIQKLINEKYSIWDWNYGYSPKYTFEKISYLSNGNILEVSMRIEKGIITNLNLEGNCLVQNKKLELVSLITNQEHYKPTISKLIKSINTKFYFNNITDNDVISSFF